MPGILILRHSDDSLKVNKRLIQNFLVNKKIEAEIIAPDDFAKLVKKRKYDTVEDMSIKCNTQLAYNFFNTQKIERGLIASDEFNTLAEMKNDKTKFASFFAELSKEWPENVEVIFFEANLFFPSEEELNEITIMMLIALLDKYYNEPLIILNSNTEKAIYDAEKHLHDQKHPPEKILKVLGAPKWDDELKRALAEKLLNSENSISSWTEEQKREIIKEVLTREELHNPESSIAFQNAELKRKFSLEELFYRQQVLNSESSNSIHM